jgi:mannose-1-phosphate guanylyltransferase
MKTGSNHWALILAAGAGTRLKSLTTDRNGDAIPKQFCSLDGGPSLLRQTINRALDIVPLARTTIVVAQEQARHWTRAVVDLSPHNIVVQPQNRGTAIGILLPLLHILRRDRHAKIALLPSDHFVEDEATLRIAMKHAFSTTKDDVTFLGIEPDCADPELGYIVAGNHDGTGRHRIARFVEKPELRTAAALIGAGALWNSFILVASGQALLELIARRRPNLHAALEAAIESPSSERALCELYAALPTVDFSRDVVEGAEQRLTVTRVPACGWTDLGTPQRVAECLSRQRAASCRVQPSPFKAPINLADAHARLQALIGQPAVA